VRKLTAVRGRGIRQQPRLQQPSMTVEPTQAFIFFYLYCELVKMHMRRTGVYKNYFIIYQFVYIANICVCLPSLVSITNWILIIN
jgi:hypothetical protein